MGQANARFYRQAFKRLRMSMNMNIKRACMSFLIAALVPVTLAFFFPFSASNKLTFVDYIVGYGLWLFFIIPVIFCIGFPALFLALRVKFGPVFLPPMVGGFSGFVFGKILYNPDTSLHDRSWLVVDGVAAAVIAAFIYFAPWRRFKSVSKYFSGERGQRTKKGNS